MVIIVFCIVLTAIEATERKVSLFFVLFALDVVYLIKSSTLRNERVQSLSDVSNRIVRGLMSQSFIELASELRFSLLGFSN